MIMKKLLFIGIGKLKIQLTHYQDTLILRVIGFTGVQMEVKPGDHTGTKFIIIQMTMLDGNLWNNMIYVVFEIAVIVYIQMHIMKVTQMEKNVTQIVLIWSK